MCGSGVPKRVAGDPGVAGQPGDVEPAVGDLGPAVPQQAALPQGVDAGAELLQRVRHPDQRHPLWEGRRPSTLTNKILQRTELSKALVRQIIAPLYMLSYLSRVNHTTTYVYI